MAINFGLYRDSQGRLDGANPLGAVDADLILLNIALTTAGRVDYLEAKQ